MMQLIHKTLLTKIVLTSLYPKYLTRFFLPVTEREKIQRLKTLERKKKKFFKHKSNANKIFKKKLNTTMIQGIDNNYTINTLVLKKKTINMNSIVSISTKKILGKNKFKHKWQAPLFLGYKKKSINYINNLVRNFRIFKTSKKRLYIIGLQNKFLGLYLVYSSGILGSLSKKHLICGKNILKTKLRKLKRLKIYKTSTVKQSIFLPFKKLILHRCSTIKIFKNFSKSKRKRSIYLRKGKYTFCIQKKY